MRKNKSEEIQERKQGIEKKGLAAIENYFDLNSTQLEKKDAEVLRHLYNMARLGKIGRAACRDRVSDRV
jgi:hypothetical protein